MRRIQFRVAALIVVTAVVAVTASAAVATSADSQTVNEDGLALLPPSVRKHYAGYTYFSTLKPANFGSYTAPKAPWKFCFNTFTTGNSWMVNVVKQLKKNVAQFKKAGLAKGNLVVSDSNGNVSLQLSQLNNQVQQGCNAILLLTANPTALCSGVQKAFKKNVVVVSFEAPTRCRGIVNVGFNEYIGGRLTSQWLADSMAHKGEVLLMNGIQGHPGAVARRAAALDVFKKYSAIKVAGEIWADWNPATAKSKLLQFLATHPQEIGGAWQAGLYMPVIGQAFEQVGRPIPKINGFTGDCSELAYWKDNNLTSLSLSQGGGPAIYEAFHVAVRVLSGQKPTVNTILYPLPTITQSTLGKWYKPYMTVNSACDSLTRDGRAVGDNYFDAFFTGGAKVPAATKP